MRSRSALPGFLALYALLFAAFGVASPFLPGLLLQDGLTPASIGVVLAAGTGIRLLAGPLGGRLADRSGRPALVLCALTAAAAVIALGYVPARGLPLLMLVAVAHAAVLAPLNPIADALALGSSRQPPGFEYGWVRAAGSAAFIAGTLASGQSIGRAGLGVIVWLNAGLLAAACIAWRVPNRVAGTGGATAPGSLRPLLAMPMFRRLMLAASLIGGSHVMHDSFEVIRWRSAGLGAGQVSVLWSMSVAAEVGVFLFLGRGMVQRIGPGPAMMLSATAGSCAGESPRAPRGSRPCCWSSRCTA